MFERAFSKTAAKVQKKNDIIHYIYKEITFLTFDMAKSNVNLEIIDREGAEEGARDKEAAALAAVFPSYNSYYRAKQKFDAE